MPPGRPGAHPLGTEIVPLPPAARLQATEVLTRAFMHDPSSRRIFPEEDRRRSMTGLWQARLTTCLRYGQVLTTPGRAGVSCWLSPGNTDLTCWKILRTGVALPPAVVRFQPEPRWRFMDMVNATDRLRLQQMRLPHWYLWALGADLGRQRHGIGIALLEPILERAVRDGTPCYLETETEANPSFYPRRGFEDEIARLQLWSMARPPRPGSETGSGVA